MEISKRLEDAYIQRMPEDLKEKFCALSPEERAAILRALVRFYQIIEEETFQLVSGLVNVYSTSKKE